MEVLLKKFFDKVSVTDSVVTLYTRT